MAVEQLKNLIGVIRKDPARAPDGQYDQVSQGKTSVVADMYNLEFKDKRALAEVCYLIFAIKFILRVHEPHHDVLRDLRWPCLVKPMFLKCLIQRSAAHKGTLLTR
jgi:hypothetical protein